MTTAECEGRGGHLPNEIIGAIVSYLPLQDVVACRLVCSRWAAAIDTCPPIWKQLLMDVFPYVLQRSSGDRACGVTGSSPLSSSSSSSASSSSSSSSAATAAVAAAKTTTTTTTTATTKAAGAAGRSVALSTTSSTSTPSLPSSATTSDTRTQGQSLHHCHNNDDGQINDDRGVNSGAAAAAAPRAEDKRANAIGYRATFMAECRRISRWRSRDSWTLRSFDPPVNYESTVLLVGTPYNRCSSAYRAMISLKGTVLTTTHDDGTVRMHRLESDVLDASLGPRSVVERQSRTGIPEEVAVVSLASPHDIDAGGPAHVWTGGMDASVCVWDLATRTRVARIADAFPSPVLCMHGCDGAVITGSLCGSVRLWTGPSLAESTLFREV